MVSPPHIDDPIAAEATALGLGTLSGMFNPTEAVPAWQVGVTAAMLFPASLLGPDFATVMHGPLPERPFVATGGINLAGVEGWLADGAPAVAVGSALIGDALDDEDHTAPWPPARRESARSRPIP
ncbi:hypothetical protein AVL59_23940 [Streptomyces griseochromogenes]|uniref:2-dehydro-3-deoxyphosphogluconate aldolase n=1 Tax=Streptomyces griseochromogenes TaxID=68214 RepID=A0A1B1B048_9ACTN|nr:hypothetical protein AVL59_23940 [Streptomyces griseochromogenes]